jgi:hypothetical protein
MAKRGFLSGVKKAALKVGLPVAAKLTETAAHAVDKIEGMVKSQSDNSPESRRESRLSEPSAPPPSPNLSAVPGGMNPPRTSGRKTVSTTPVAAKRAAQKQTSEFKVKRGQKHSHHR